MDTQQALQLNANLQCIQAELVISRRELRHLLGDIRMAIEELAEVLMAAKPGEPASR